jgi:hypothetical protein
MIIQRSQVRQQNSHALVEESTHSRHQVRNMDKSFIRTCVIKNKVTIPIPLSQSKDLSIQVKLEPRGEYIFTYTIRRGHNMTSSPRILLQMHTRDNIEYLV